jgi:hypothetical protein
MLDSIVRLFDCSIVRLFNCSIVQLFDCSIVRLFNCSMFPFQLQTGDRRPETADRRPPTADCRLKFFFNRPGIIMPFSG